MSNTLTAQIRSVVKCDFGNVLDLRTVTDPLDTTYANTLANGTGADKAQVMFVDQRSLNNASEELDLAGSLVSAFGVVTFTKIKLLLIRVTTVTSGAVLNVGGAASNALSTLFGNANDIAKAHAGGELKFFSPVDGYVVTAGTADILKIENPAIGAVAYDIIIIGEGSVA